MKVFLVNLSLFGGGVGVKVDEGAVYVTEGRAAYITTPYIIASETFTRAVLRLVSRRPITTATERTPAMA